MSVVELDIHNSLHVKSDREHLIPVPDSCQEEKTNKANFISDRLSVKVSNAMPQRETPQDYINRIMRENGLTHRKVAERANALGLKLSGGYVHNVASGDVDNPSLGLIRAIAAGLGRPEEELIAVFRGKLLTDDNGYTESLFAVMWNEYKRLPAKEQKELRPSVDMLRREIQRRTAKD